MMESHANMAKLEFLNSFFTERLLAVAGEIFQVVKDTIIDYQEEIDRAKQENHHLKEMLMEKCINDGSGHHRNIQAVHEAADFSQTPDSESSIIKVKLELCTVQQDAEPREFLCNSPSPVCNGAPQHFSVKTISDEKEADVPSNNSGVAVKVEPPDSRVICSDNSGCDMQGEGVPDNPAVDLQDRCRLHPKKAPTPQQGQTRWNMPNTYTWPSQDTRQGQDVLHHTNAVDRTEALREMDLKITYLTSLVESLVGGRRILSPQQVQDEEEMNVFPLNSMEALEDLEKRLLDNGLKQRMVSIQLQ
ncbi:uncharacterized protein LOC143496047 isoform X3 [Brachyhypopomus gauderio]|uniref:uncharacterized protein LOC143496047 isoform X3 n=1 Tax=Brachyhypopomus gauderio TaxID=698409 RepID=UPI0040413A14